MMMNRKSRAAVLRKMLKEQKVVVAPAAGDALAARMIEDAGFQAFVVSGSSMANLNMGLPDVGVMSYSEIRDCLSNMLRVTTIPAIVDIDTGYGGTLPLYRLVREYEALDVAAVQLEDQIFPKMCAYFSGTSVVSADEMIGRIRAVVKARRADLYLIARTDAAKSLGFEEALRRARLYYEAGADMIFITVPPSAEDMKRIAELPFPVCTSVVEGTVNEDFTVDQLADMGFRLVKYPQTLIRATMKTMHDVLSELKTSGSTRGYRNRICTQKERAVYSHVGEFTQFQNEVDHSSAVTVEG